jgi:hypothetical protein
MNKLNIRCPEFVMDARRKLPPNVVHCARLATPQTHEFGATLRAGVSLCTSLCRKPFVVNDTTARLASRPVRKDATANIQFIHS